MKSFLLMSLILLPSLAHADDEAAYKKNVDAVVSVVSFGKTKDDCQFGSGVLLPGGTILTANHVLKAGGTTVVYFRERDSKGAVIVDGEYYLKRGKAKACTLVATSIERDLALLLLHETPTIQPISPSNGTGPGQSIFVIGAACVGSGMWHYAPGSTRQVVQRSYSLVPGVVKAKVLEITIPINPGDSGGPILNQAGELVGIVSATITGKNQLHYGIDISEVRAFLLAWAEEPTKLLQGSTK